MTDDNSYIGEFNTTCQCRLCGTRFDEVVKLYAGWRVQVEDDGSQESNPPWCAACKQQIDQRVAKLLPPEEEQPASEQPASISAEQLSGDMLVVCPEGMAFLWPLSEKGADWLADILPPVDSAAEQWNTGAIGVDPYLVGPVIAMMTAMGLLVIKLEQWQSAEQQQV